MLCGFDSIILDADIYAKKLGVLYKNKEKISSCLGFFLSIIYIFISLGIFVFYTIQTLQRLDLTVNDSTIYSKEIPNIDLNNSDLLYFAFAVEKPITADRFIDETIYTVKAIFYDNVKNENGTFERIESRDLKVEKCKQEKFGEDYQYLFKEGEFNNSYCLSSLDFILTGGFIYDRLSFIGLEIFPCKNSTENNFHCKSQEIIDKFLGGGYFSILLKDIGLNPRNYSFPVLPTLQDIYTTISKQFYRDLILYYEITEIRTDKGFFLERFYNERYLKFDKKIETLFLRNEESYYNGESIMSIQIRLSDNIHVQNREYRKMHNVFATTGGYMQMLNTIFSLLIIFPNKFFYDNIIVNNLFDFDLNKNKIHIKRSVKPLKIIKRKYMSDLEFLKKESSNIKSNINLKTFNRDENVNNESRSENKSRSIFKSNMKFDKSMNMSAYEKINYASKIDIIPFTTDLKILNNNKLILVRKSKKNEKSTKEMNATEEGHNYIHFNLNICDYLCLGRYKKNNKNYNLFNKATLIFKQKLDIINIFNYILQSEKIKEEIINKFG